jgi:hypothetical protein
MKVGFRLVPVALAGLGRVTHLINIDTAEDLIALMRSILESQPPAPCEMRLHCILCALRTLAGPGQELNIDEEVFVNGLLGLMADVSADFARWDLVLECVELCLMKKREVRNVLIISFVRLLLINASHITSSIVSATVLSAVQTILLRYPRARGNLGALSARAIEEEEVVGDLAMAALR